jgi:hypothetical protein
MKPVQQLLKLMGVCVGLVVGLAAPASGQELESESERDARLARRSMGVRAGVWNVDVTRVEAAVRSPHMEGYYQRGLNRRLALENSLAIWRVKTTSAQPSPGAPRVESRTYIAPLLTSLKVYPFTTPDHTFEPYFLAGAGFAFGVEDEDENAIGGGGTTVVTGLGLRLAAGIEMRLGGPLGIAAAGKYQWVHFGEDLVTMSSYAGVGVEGAVTYRFQF